MPNRHFFQAIDQALHSRTQAAQSHGQHVREFLNANPSAARYVIGKNDESAALSKLIPLAGVIDDHAQAASWNGLPLVKMSDVPRQAWVLNCSTSIAPVNVDRALKQAGFDHILSLSDLLQHPQCPSELLPQFVYEQHHDYTQHMSDWSALYNRMADEVSRQTLLDVLRFRLTADPQHMQNYSVRFHDQYFEDFLNFGEEVFVDAGGYDGDTTEEFCKRAPGYKRVYLFEPSAINMAAARKRLAAHRNIEFMEMGLSDSAGELCFDPDAGSASSVSKAGVEKIVVNTLDATVLEPVSFIKMDLEGWELHALAGCRNQIKQNKPKLAISVYHQASHFREVMDWVLSIHPDYKVRLRHYTQGWSETVMFFTCE